MSEPVRERVIFTGRVQGVFFRATCVEIARDFEVTGRVRNLADGTVELEAQGAAGEIERFLGAIRARYTANIKGMNRESIPTASGEHALKVQY